MREHEGSGVAIAAADQQTVPLTTLTGFLGADNYCQGYRPAARRPQIIDTGMSHIGFRCIVRPDSAAHVSR